MSAVEVDGLGKRFGRRWALRDCTLGLPAGRVVGLVGANGAGKSTLLQLVVGLLEPTEGSVTVAGGIPGRDGAQMARVGFVAQDAPVYSSLTVGEHLELGARLNPGWDAAHAAERVRAAELDVTQRAGHLSGGQRAQLALSLAMGKRPEVLVLDEPVASLDPLARRQFLAALMGTVAAGQPTIILSSHLLADIERVCDHLVVVDRGRVRVEGAVDALLATHRVLTGPRRSAETLPADQTVVHASHTDRQTTVVVRTEHPIRDPAWIVGEIGLEELVLAYMEGGPAGAVAPARLAAVPS